MPPKGKGAAARGPNPIVDPAILAYIAKAGKNESMVWLWLQLQDTTVAPEPIVASIIACGLEKKYLHMAPDPSGNCLKDFTPVMLAAKANRTDVVKILLKDHKKVKLDHISRPLPQISVFYLAAANSNSEMLTLLAAHDPKALKDLGSMPYIAALYNKDYTAYDCLASCVGVPPSIISDAASISNNLVEHMDIFEYLFAKGLDPNVPGMFGMNALAHAARHGFMELMRLLLQNGANPNSPSKEGSKSTVLHHALRLGRTETAKVLIEKDADLYSLDDDGRTPLDIAKASEDPEVVAIFVAESNKRPAVVGAKRSRSSE